MTRSEVERCDCPCCETERKRLADVAKAAKREDAIRELIRAAKSVDEEYWLSRDTDSGRMRALGEALEFFEGEK